MQFHSKSAFSRTEFVVIMACVWLLASVLLSGSQVTRKQSLEAGCVFNLRHLSIAAFSWASDHSNTFPWQVFPISMFGPFVEDGAQGMPNAWQHYWVMRKEINDPRKLWCPSDSQRVPAEHWERTDTNGFPSAAKMNNAVSYFVGLHAGQPYGNNPVFGDRNIDGGVRGTVCAYMRVPGGGDPNVAYQISSREDLRWSTNMHGVNKGNLALSDGSVAQTTDVRLRQAVADAEATEGNRNFHILLPQ